MSEKASNNGSKIAIRVAIAAVLVAALVIAIRYSTRTEVEIRAAKADYTDLISNLSTNGKVEPLQSFQAHAAEPGSVQAVFVKSGQTVPAGTLLVRMDSSVATARVETARSAIAQAAAAQSDLQNGGTADERIGITGDLDRAKVQFGQAQKDLSALQALQARGAASSGEVSSAQARVVSAQSSLESLQQRSTARYSGTDKQRVQAQLNDSKASLSAAADSLSKDVIRAPFAGTIFSLPVKPFDFVGAGEELVQLADLTHLQVRAYFDEPEIGKLKLNDHVLIRWDARPNEIWHGHIVRTPTTIITYGTRFVGECLIAVDDATDHLLPNTNVNVSVTTQEIHHVLSIPRESLRTQGTENFVFLIQGSELVRHDVQVGAANLNSVQITSGLTPGDQVALSSVSSSVDLKEGQRIKVVQ